MAQRRNKRPVLEPVLENYMGPPISFADAAGKPPRHGGSRLSSKVAPLPGPGKPVKGSMKSKNPLHIFGKLRDRYVNAMNEMAMGGDFAAVAGYHGCAPGQDYPGTTDHDRSRERELQVLQEELAALRRLQSEAQSSKAKSSMDAC